jgi:muconolactone delta-isomerase
MTGAALDLFINPVAPHDFCGVMAIKECFAGEDNMKILAMERELPGIAKERFTPHLKAEAARAWELYQAGVLRELYFRQDRHTTVLVLECADAGEAQRVLASLPQVREGLIVFDVIPLVPYPRFARLFAERA